MHAVLNILLYLALAATAITLVIGMATMFRSDKKGHDGQSNKLMRFRVMFQAITLIVLALLLFTAKHQ